LVSLNILRLTKVGSIVRSASLDELLQLINVLKGDMSLVGPRPEVRKYVNIYTPEQMMVLEVSPGITDYASIQFINENQLLANAENPDEYYINNIMPKKLEMNLQYIKSNNPFKDIILILKTIFRIIF
jgi:lipopolysaccharide/colanic/teichoic acid biosynthesis glycosyltransferase